MSNEKRKDVDFIADGLLPLLRDVAEGAIKAGSVDAASPLIERAALFLGTEYVASMREIAATSYKAGLEAGFERAWAPLQ